MDDDQYVPVYGFGDHLTADKKVFAFHSYHQPLVGKQSVLQQYREILPRIQLAGTTSFAPMIYEAVDLVKQSGKYHVLLIIADGAVTEMQKTIDAVMYASNFPLSIVIVGVGDGPWDQMKELDDSIPSRKWDNVQFVNFIDVMTNSHNAEHAKITFALQALMEIPDQYKIIKKLGLISNKQENPEFKYRMHHHPALPPAYQE